MTNKKFKLAAMSLALTACVAASPLAANAETGAEATSSAPAVETPAPAAEPSAENAPTTNKDGQEAANNNEQEAADKNEQEATDVNDQKATDVNDPKAADVNGVPAAAKAPVLMLAKAPAAPTGTPTTPAENKTVATITRQDGTTTTTTEYTSFDDAVKAAKDNDIIKVIEDTETDGMELKKDLTIQGVAIETTKKKGGRH